MPLLDKVSTFIENSIFYYMNIGNYEASRAIRRSESACARLSRDGQEYEGSWKLAAAAEIKWVRLVQDRGGTYGIGFLGDQLVYFLGAQITHGLVRRVSAFESIVLLRCLAGRELDRQPDVESNSAAWKRWLGLLQS